MRTFLMTLALLAPTFGQADSTEFNGYWHAGKAELSSYTLEQARYGELHAGTAVLVFVTESMNPKTQVKADRPGPDSVPVLKLNFTRKFNTGIYPYSVMTSIFAPEPRTGSDLPLKISTSVQEWCGHVFVQLNRRQTGYAVESRSYFESEGDKGFMVGDAFPEDAIFTRARPAPKTLPVGDFSMLPGTLYTRLKHRPLKAVPVKAALEEVVETGEAGAKLNAYTVHFTREGRVLRVLFERNFPHRIEGWTDSYPPIFGSKAPLVSRAKRKHTIREPYWNLHGNAHRAQRTRLGLSTD